MSDNLIQSKSFDFAVRIVKLHQYLVAEKREYRLSDQIVKSGTSIGANVEEGIGGQSKRDFIAKFQISLKEARETHYWIRLLVATNYITTQEADSLLADCKDIVNILTAILKKAKENV